MPGRPYRTKSCQHCGEPYVPAISIQKYCRRPGRLVWADESWRAASKSARLRRRREIQQRWGQIEGPNNPRKGLPAERYAVRLLRQSYDRVTLLTTLDVHATFDILARRGAQRDFYQVTCRTHTEPLARQLEMAELLGCRYFVIFVKPDLSFHVIREVVRGRATFELRLSDLEGVVA